MSENKAALRRVIERLKSQSEFWPSDEIDFMEKILSDLDTNIETEND